MNSPIDVLFYKKIEEIEKQIPKPKSKQLNELREYVEKTRELTFEQIIKEYSDPSKSYPIFDTPNLKGDAIGWSCQFEDDPRFDATVKTISDGVYQFDFNFFGSKDYNQNLTKKIKGTDYMNTLHKIVKDKLIPFINKKEIGDTLYFNVNNKDGMGEARKKVFSYLINKYIDKNKFEIENENYDFNITKIK